mgnify:FL=1
MIKYLLFCWYVILFLSCGGEERPSYAMRELIFPDYRDVTIPVNIAPLSFYVNLPEMDKDVRILLRTQTCELVRQGKEICFSSHEWRELVMSDSVLNVWVQKKTDRLWNNVDSFKIYVSADPIDPYLSYRLIEPGYEVWGNMGIYQRCLANYEENAIFENSGVKETCVNCHTTNQGNPEEYIFHQRSKSAGTILVKDGVVSKLNTDYSEKIKALVYPSWHLSGKYIAFSVNKTVQTVHSQHRNRIEVMDLHSDIVILDVQKNILLTSSQLSSADAYETFPCFSSDGKKLYFCSAPAISLPDSFNFVQYNLCSLDVDLEKGVLGSRIDTVIRVDTLNASLSFPKISPSGRFMLYTRHAYGNFSIWHRDADLCMYDLQSQREIDISVLNSEEAESFHSWSSEGHWIVFSSRRMTGLFTCLYLAHIDSLGHAGKPFLLPQKSNDSYFFQYKSYNVPEFMKGMVRTNRKELEMAIGR